MARSCRSAGSRKRCWQLIGPGHHHHPAEDNEKDLADIPEAVLDVLELHLVESMDEVLKIALTEPLTSLIPSPEEPDSQATDDQITH